MNIKNSKLFRNRIYTVSIFAALSFCLLLIYSPTTSPLAADIASDGDSTIFQVIGRFWLEGKIPYIDLWDLKGPYIFLMNAIGYLITGDKTGVFIIQTIHLMSVFCIIWYYSDLFLSTKTTIVVMILVILYYLMNFDSGNLTEEYCMPWLLLSILLQYQWVVSINDDHFEHKPKNAFLYGICFSICLLTRVTNAIAVCAGVLVITCCLLVKKKYVNLLKNAVLFIAGVMIVLQPFVIYYAAHDGVKDLAYGTVLYNMGYYQASGFHFEPGSVRSLVMYLGGYLAVIVAAVTVFCTRRKLEGLLCFVVTAVPYVFLMTCNGYRHYNMILTPGLLLALFEIYTLETENIGILRVKSARILCVVYVVAIVIIGTGYSAPLSFRSIQRINNRNSAEDYWGKAQYDLVSLIPESGKEAFIAYDCDPGIYLTADIPPCYRFFTLQEWEISQNASLKPLIVDEFEKGEAAWILISEGEHSIDHIIEKDYELYEEQVDISGQTYYLYRKSESD